MTTLAIASLFVGVLIIVVRVSLVFAPTETAAFYRRMLATTQRVRVLAAVLVPIAVYLLWASLGEAGTLATVIAVVGWLMVGGAVFLFVAPGIYQQLAERILEGFDDLGLRAIGVLGVGVGALFVYFGATAA